MLRRIAIAAILFLAGMSASNAMTFTVRDKSTVLASGPIEVGDAAEFAALPKFDTLELNSPGGLVGEALRIAANMDARGGVRTVVTSGSSCASACAMALFVSGKTRLVYMGGRIGIHSCRNPDDTEAPECNTLMAANATAHGVPWGVIEGFDNNTKPSDMQWIGAESAECWGLMKWNAADTSNDGIACFKWSILTTSKGKPPPVTAKAANHVLCRLNAQTSSIYVPSGNAQQGFSDTYRRACERIVADPKTPKYAAVDILMWLTLSDPKVLAIKPGTLMASIVNDDTNIGNCWKCLTIIGMTAIMHGYADEALADFLQAEEMSKRDTGFAPDWLTERVGMAEAEVAKGQH